MDASDQSILDEALRRFEEKHAPAFSVLKEILAIPNLEAALSNTSITLRKIRKRLQSRQRYCEGE